MKACVSRRGAVAAAGLTAVAGLSACGNSELSQGAGSGGSDAGTPATAGAESGSAAEKPSVKSRAEQVLEAMTLEQKVAQLFVVTPERLTGVDCATIAGDLTRQALQEIPVGGLCYFSRNITGVQQLRDLLAGTLELSRASGAGIGAFLTVDEEGGPLVARVANSGYFSVETFPNMAQIGASGDESQAAHVGETIGSYLHEIGFNVDFAPVADVNTNPDNPVIGPRAFSNDDEVAAQMVSAEVAAMLKTGTLPCIKHFPGHGDTAGDSHTGAVMTVRTREEIESCEYKPFEAGIAAGCPMVMVGHIETPNLSGDDLPATLSHVLLTDELRGKLGFEGVIISDSFEMGAITDNFEPADAALRFIEAGGDVILMTADLRVSYQGILDAVATGALTESRIDESVLRVLKVKDQAGLLPQND